MAERRIVYPPRITLNNGVPRGHQRGGALGQIDEEMGHGPRPLPISEVPSDILPRYIQDRLYSGGGVGLPGGPGAPQGLDALSGIADDVRAIAGTLLLRRGLLGRVVTVTGTPTLIIDVKETEGRGYLLLNPAGVVGLTAVGTLIASNTAVGATTVTSASLGVANYLNGKFFVDITFTAGAGPVTFDLQSKNPVTGTFITTQTLWSLTATGKSYADVGTLGVDTDLQMLVTVPAGTTVTFSVGFVLKDGLEGTSTGVAQTIFIGNSGLSPVSAYPLLSGKEKQFYLSENVQLWAVTLGPSLDMNIFEI